MQQQFQRVTVETLAYALAPEICTSAAIEEALSEVYGRLKMPLGRLELMTGIQERRFWPNGTLPSEMAAQAGRKALEQSVVAPEQLDLLIFAGVCRDRLEPATASNVHALLGLPPSVAFFDLGNACLGFCNALALAGGLVEAGQVQSVLVVSGENGRPLLDWTLEELRQPQQTRQSFKRYFANLTIGGGAVAAVVCRSELAEKPRGKPAPPAAPDKSAASAAMADPAESPALPVLRLRYAVSRSDTTASGLCQGGTSDAGGLAMLTDSEELMVAGVNLAEQTWEAFQTASGWSAGSLHRVVCHQVGRQHQRALLERLGIPLEKDFPTYPKLGNVGSVSLPITLAMAREVGAVSSGQRVVGLGIGSGLSCMVLGWEID